MGNDRREVNRKAITKQLTWVQAAEIRGVSSRHMWRIRLVVEQHGLVAVMAKAAGGPGASGFWTAADPSTIELLCRLSHDLPQHRCKQPSPQIVEVAANHTDRSIRANLFYIISVDLVTTGNYH